MRTIDNLTIIECPQDALSADYPSLFTFGGVPYCSAAQFIAFKKALLFRDMIIAKRIQEAQDLIELDSLSKAVRGFDEANWVRHRDGIAKTAAWEKFSQNEELATVLDDTGDTELIVANSVNGVWGIAIPAGADSTDRSKWTGLNLWGQVLMSTRKALRNLKNPCSPLIQDETPEPVSIAHKIDICSSWSAGFSVIVPREHWLPELQALPREVLEAELTKYMAALKMDKSNPCSDTLVFLAWVEHELSFSF